MMVLPFWGWDRIENQLQEFFPNEVKSNKASVQGKKKKKKKKFYVTGPTICLFLLCKFIFFFLQVHHCHLCTSCHHREWIKFKKKKEEITLQYERLFSFCYALLHSGCCSSTIWQKNNTEYNWSVFYVFNFHT